MSSTTHATVHTWKKAAERTFPGQFNEDGSGAMTIEIQPMAGSLGAIASGVRLSEIDSAAVEELHAALLRHLMLCIRGQHLTPVMFRDAMCRFGTPEPTSDGRPHPEVSELTIISHDDRAKTGKVAGFNWHSDQSFRVRPVALSMLYGIQVPETGGDTQFANMYSAYEEVAEPMKQRVDGLWAVHRYRSNRKDTLARGMSAEKENELPEALHPIVRTHPETGRKALYLNRNRMDRIPGLDEASSEALLDDLIEHATQPRFTYRHMWQTGDVVIWDNRCTMHKANGDYPEGAHRYLLRMTTQGGEPV
jgi:taurine dioxygenase